ncbi:MAG: glutamine--tRNA ligase, partial [bacterium]
MTEESSKPTNFVRQIIDADLESGKHTAVQTRFPPEPNGYLHIGHAKSIVVNFGIAQDYQGQCNLRFDDTNPHKENEEFVEAIKADVEWLGYEWAGLYFASDYFEQLYQFAIELIKAGKAYVCDLNAEEVREYRGTLTAPGKDSPNRDRTVEENLQLFEQMRAGAFEDGSRTLRAKIDMAAPNMNMRDPALYRIRHGVIHHQTGDAWCIYPMYDFTHPISDALEGVTHSLCTLEFEDHRPLYDWVLDNISIACHPQQIEFSRLNLEYTVMSKRKLT